MTEKIIIISYALGILMIAFGIMIWLIEIGAKEDPIKLYYKLQLKRLEKRESK